MHCGPRAVDWMCVGVLCVCALFTSPHWYVYAQRWRHYFNKQPFNLSGISPPSSPQTVSNPQAGFVVRRFNGDANV